MADWHEEFRAGLANLLIRPSKPCSKQSHDLFRSGGFYKEDLALPFAGYVTLIARGTPRAIACHLGCACQPRRTSCPPNS